MRERKDKDKGNETKNDVETEAGRGEEESCPSVLLFVMGLSLILSSMLFYTSTTVMTRKSKFLSALIILLTLLLSSHCHGKYKKIIMSSSFPLTLYFL